MKNLKIIGIYGYSRSGKDTIANYLVKNHNFERRAFADPLRKVLLEIMKPLNPLMAEYIEFFGWDSAKIYPEIVDAMIALGSVCPVGSFPFQTTVTTSPAKPLETLPGTLPHTGASGWLWMLGAALVAGGGGIWYAGSRFSSRP